MEQNDKALQENLTIMNSTMSNIGTAVHQSMGILDQLTTYQQTPFFTQMETMYPPTPTPPSFSQNQSANPNLQ